MNVRADPDTQYWTGLDTGRTPNSGTLTSRPASTVAVNTTALNTSENLVISGLNSGDIVTVLCTSSTQWSVASTGLEVTMVDSGQYTVDVQSFPTQSSSFYVTVT